MVSGPMDWKSLSLDSLFLSASKSRGVHVRLVFIQQGLDGHSRLCQGLICSSDVAVYLVQYALRRDVCLVKASYQFVDAVPQCAVFVVEIFIERILLQVPPYHI